VLCSFDSAPRDAPETQHAVVLPAFAAANKDPEIVALASATPRSSSSRKRLRSVFGAQPMIRAMPTLAEADVVGGI
jgi:hypothetical protein